MGVIVYWLIVAAVLLFGLTMPQVGRRKKEYIFLMFIVHTFVCGFKHQFLVGDLIKYYNTYTTYFQFSDGFGWFSDAVFSDGRNTGWNWLNKAVGLITQGNFQVFIFILALITQSLVFFAVYKYSPRPWLSFFVWNCMAFYVNYDFCAIKQGLAMSILMLALMCIFEERLFGFLFFTLLAGFIHAPALIFLPAYWIAKLRFNYRTVIVYIAAAVLIFMFRSRLVTVATDTYYADNDEISFAAASSGVGGRFFVICLIALAGFMVKGFKERNFVILFNFIVMAAILQMFSIYNNVFTRLSDYYLQFTILYIPMIFYKPQGTYEAYTDTPLALLRLDDTSKKIAVAALSLVLMWWYQKTCLGVDISASVDNYTNFRFMWQDVQSNLMYFY